MEMSTGIAEDHREAATQPTAELGISLLNQLIGGVRTVCSSPKIEYISTGGVGGLRNCSSLGRPPPCSPFASTSSTPFSRSRFSAVKNFQKGGGAGKGAPDRWRSVIVRTGHKE